MNKHEAPIISNTINDAAANAASESDEDPGIETGLRRRRGRLDIV
jgi:hypothetical protein